MAERENLAKTEALEQAFSLTNPVVRGLLQTGGKVVSPVYDAASYGLNLLGIPTPSFEQATGIKPYGSGPGASGESVFFRSPVQTAVAADRAFREDLTRRGKVVTPAAEIDRTGGMTGPGVYMQEAARRREAEEQQEAAVLKQKMDRDNATGTPNIMPYVATGDNRAQNARERSFLERMAQSGLLSTLQGMARAERQYGVGPLAAFSESALDVQAARSAAQQEAVNRQAKILAEQIKKSGPMEFKGPMIKTIEKASSTKQSLDAINRYLELLGNKRIGGVGAKIEEGINAIGALFGAGGESGAATADSIRSQIITGLQMGVSQGQISQGDYEQLNKILSGSGWFVSNPKVEAQLQRLKGVLGGKLRTTTKILEAQGVDPSYFSPDAPSGLVSARRPAR